MSTKPQCTACATPKKRDGMWKRGERTAPFSMIRPRPDWVGWYWIRIPDGVQCAHATELTWDDEPPR